MNGNIYDSNSDSDSDDGPKIWNMHDDPDYDKVSNAIDAGKPIKTIDNLIKKYKLDINAQYEEDLWTFLHNAVHKSDVELVQYLLSEPYTNPNIRDKYGETPLHLAVKNIALENEISTLKSSANHAQKMQSMEEIIQELLENGADGTIQNHSEKTPIQMAKVETRHAVKALESLPDPNRTLAEIGETKGIPHEVIANIASFNRPRGDAPSMKKLFDRKFEKKQETAKRDCLNKLEKERELRRNREEELQKLKMAINNGKKGGRKTHRNHKLRKLTKRHNH